MTRLRTGASAVLALAVVAACTAAAPVSRTTPSVAPSPAVVEQGSPRRTAHATDPLAAACSVRGTVDRSFVIAESSDYRDYLPAMGDSPELEGRSGLLVVLYEDPAEVLYLTGIPGASREPVANGVVCVVSPDRTPDVYTDVSREGLDVTRPAEADVCEDWIGRIREVPVNCRRDAPTSSAALPDDLKALLASTRWTAPDERGVYAAGTFATPGRPLASLSAEGLPGTATIGSVLGFLAPLRR